MAERLFKLKRAGEIVFPVTTTDAVVDPRSLKTLTTILDETLDRLRTLEDQAGILWGPSVLLPAYDGTDSPRSLSVSVFQETVLEKVIKSDLLVKVSDLEENYYNKQEVDDLIAPLQPEKIDELIQIVERLDGDVEEEGSVKFQINEAKQDLIGTPEDPSSRDTINAAKNLVADSLQFIIYN